MNKKFLMIGGIAVVVLGTAYFLLSPSAPPPKTAQLAGANSPPPPSVWTDNPVELANTSHGFYFRYPKDWGAGYKIDGDVVESVGRRDGVYCSVSVIAKRHDSDPTGKPKALPALMAAMTDKNVSGLYKGAKATVEKFAPGTLGKQESREFVMAVTGQAVGQIKVHGHVTLRDHGVIYLFCAASAKSFPGKDVQDPFRLVRDSFEFDGRAR